jgi:plasmid stabilization system protein ParE
MKVLITRSAEAGLFEIGMRIADDNPSRAVTFLEELRQVCNRLGDTPKAYPMVERYRSSGIRRRVFHDYLVFYRVRLEKVEVLHVLHGARDYQAILSSDFD